MPQDQQVTPAVRVGCSGWQYKHWRGDFYPGALPQTRWLEYYAEHFDTVEINNTFYRLPDAPAFASWARQAPRGFLYAVKASRFLTHMKKLKDPMQGSASGKRAIGPFVYIRFHGTQKYSGRYDDATLEEWEKWLAERHEAGAPIYA